MGHPGFVLASKGGPPAYADCVKNTGNYFSIQHGLQSISGDHLGNSWLSGALLGNPVSDMIEFGQALGNRDFSGAGGSGSSAYVGFRGAEKGLDAAKGLRDVTVVTANVSVSAIQMPGASVTSVSMNAASRTIPLGALSKVAKPLLTIAKGLNVWNYGVSAVSAGVLCNIGR